MSVTDLAAQLIAIPSVSPMRPVSPDDVPCEAQVTAFLMEWCGCRHIDAAASTAAFGRQSILAVVAGNPQRGTIVLDAHQDTVPADPAQREPFHPRVEGGRLYGRGACDVKGGMAAMLVALERIAQLPPAARPTVVFVATCDEEFGQAGAIDIVDRWQSGRLPLAVPRQVDAVIVAEPTGLHPVVAHNGVLRWTLRTAGQAAHSSRPELGSNAIEKMSDVIAAWQDYGERLRHDGLLHPRCGRPRTSIGRIVGGTAVNIVPERCEIEIDRRLVPGETVAQVWDEVARLLAMLPGSAASCSPAWTESLPLEDRDNLPLAEALIRQVRLHERPSEPIGVGFGTHAPRYVALGAPVVVFGPGSIEQAHTADEWIDVAELECAAQVLFDFARDVRAR